MRIVIDARESGTSTGRYIDKLVENLHRLKPSLPAGRPEFEIILLAKPERVNYLKQVAPDFETIECPYKEFSLGEQIGLLRQLNSLKPDLVHFGMTQQPAFYSGKVVTTIHDLTTARFDNPAKNPTIYKLKRTVYRWLIKKAAKKSQKLITSSKFVKNDVAQYANIDPAKIEVIYEAADKIEAEAEEIAKLQDQKFIMYVGRANPHKNLNRLVEAFAEVTKSHPDLKLVLAGQPDKNFDLLAQYVESKSLTPVVRNLTSQVSTTGQASQARPAPKPERSSLQSDYEASRFGAGVLFLGWINDGQLRWLYENTAAYVFPSLSEGFGLPGLEAMIHSAPVVSSDTTCLPEIYGDAAHYFDPLDVDDMAGKIIDVLENFTLSTNLIARGKAQAAKYSWQTTAKQTLEIYKAVLSVVDR